MSDSSSAPTDSPKIVVITGASTGIGAALAVECHRRGDVPVLAARRETELAALAARLLADNAPAFFVVTDVTRRADVEHLVERTLDRYGRIDVWVNNAGRGMTRSVSQLTDGDLDEMMTVNVKSALYGMQAVLPHFKGRGDDGEGHIINVSSVLGRVPFFGPRSAYSASKHFLNALTANLRMELAQTHPGIAVSLFSPGVVATDFGLNALHGGPDSRVMPNAQPADEVAVALAELMESRRADAYSRPGFAAQVAAYYAAPDLAALEAEMARPRS